MRSEQVSRHVRVSGEQNTALFGISDADQVHLMTILRDTLYTDKVLAVIREYAANAWDAHREFGKADVPIKVVLPTKLDPTLRIRDFGPGLSHKDMVTVYVMYGSSTKRDSDISTGYLGIGAKSAFSYSDSFTVTSWHCGEKRIYSAVLDKTSRGELIQMYCAPCGEETGIEVCVPVKQEDVEEFYSKAGRTLQYMTPKPDVAPQDLFEGVEPICQSKFLGRTSWTAVMGCIPYKVNMRHVEAELHELGYWKGFSSFGGVLFMGMGEVDFIANREELKYTDKTKSALISTVVELAKRHTEATLSVLASSTKSSWEKRLFMARDEQIPLPLPGVHASLRASTVMLLCPRTKSPPDENDPLNVKNAPFKVDDVLRVNESAGIVLCRSLSQAKRKNISNAHAVVTLKKGCSWNNARPVLNAYLEELGVTGVPILSADVLSDKNLSCSSHSTDNSKYKAKAFVLTDTYDGMPSSRNWTEVRRVPECTDLCVAMDAFEVCGGPEGRVSFVRLKAQFDLLAKFGIAVPPIYGYRPKDLPSVGTNAIKWLDDKLDECLNDTRGKDLIHAHRIIRVTGNIVDFRYGKREKITAVLDSFGEGHPLRVWAQEISWALDLVESLGEFTNAVKSLLIFAEKDKRTCVDLHKVLSDYPLLHSIGVYRFFPDEYLNVAIEYVQLIDEKRARERAKEG